MFIHQVLTTLVTLIICFTIEDRSARAFLTSPGRGEGSGTGFGWLGQNLGGGSASRLFVSKTSLKFTFSDEPCNKCQNMNFCGVHGLFLICEFKVFPQIVCRAIAAILKR